MAKCDICGKCCNAQELYSLYERYRFDDVVDVCKQCKKFCDEKKSLFIEQIEIKMRDAISERKFGYCVETMSWWRRLFA